MRCPRCGAFLDNGKAVCFMCGANLSSDENSSQNNFSQNNMSDNTNQMMGNGFGNSNPFDNGLSSNNNFASFGENGFNNNDNFNSFNNGSSNFNPMNNGSFNSYDNSGFNNPVVNNSGFNNPSVGDNFSQQSVTNDIFKKRDEIKVNNDYKNIKLEDIKTDKDIFDFFSEHKKGIKMFFGLILLVVGAFVFFKVYQHMTKPEEKEAVLGYLYFEVDDSFDQISSTSSQLVYSLTGDKGSDCSISITYAATTSGDHVAEFFDKNTEILAPEYDREGNVLDPTKVFQTQVNEAQFNDAKWSRQYFYYRSDVNVENYNVLKYIYLTSMYKGFYYDISLANNSNSNSCNTALDQFVNSLEFVEKADK